MITFEETGVKSNGEAVFVVKKDNKLSEVGTLTRLKTIRKILGGRSVRLDEIISAIEKR